MRIIIAGSRNLFVSSSFINEVLDRHTLGLRGHSTADIEIVSGGADGIDLAGELFAKEWSCKLKVFPADWNTHGKAAGPIRNKQMADYADSLLLIWDGESRGSRNMKETMLKLGKPVYEVILRTHN